MEISDKTFSFFMIVLNSVLYGFWEYSKGRLTEQNGFEIIKNIVAIYIYNNNTFFYFILYSTLMSMCKYILF